jgi:uncharacterized membrane protein YdbT with pleckstrin-like domain
MSADQQRAEVVVARLRPHGRALIWPTVALVTVAAVAGYFVGSFPQAWENLAAAGVTALLVLVLWVIPIIAWLVRNYTITTRRTILRQGFAVRVRQELLHSRAYDVTVRQTAAQRLLFGSGDVSISGGGDHAVVLRDVPRADLVQAALHELIEANAIGTPDETVHWGTR